VNDDDDMADNCVLNSDEKNFEDSCGNGNMSNKVEMSQIGNLSQIKSMAVNYKSIITTIQLRILL